MTTLSRTVRTLKFQIGEHEYDIPPVDDDRGTQLADILTKTPAQATRSKLHGRDLFKLAVSDDLWERMRGDGVPFTEMWRVGMAALAHFQVLLTDPNPATAYDKAEEAARGIWEAGFDPEALAAWMAAQKPSTPKRPTRAGAATTTPRRASGTGTTAKKKTTKAAQSRGSSSRRAGR